MNKTEKIIVAGIAVLLLSVGAMIVLGKKSQNFGSLFVEQHSYSAAATYASTTLTNNVAASLLSRATSSRTFARICVREDSANNVPVKLWKQATSTGVVTVSGHPIYSSSTAGGQNCMTLDANDPYLGQVWGISAATTSVTIESLQE